MREEAMEGTGGGVGGAHTSVCRVDGLIGLGTLSVHKHTPNEELVGHAEGQLVHRLFHLGREFLQGFTAAWILHKVHQ